MASPVFSKKDIPLIPAFGAIVLGISLLVGQLFRIPLPGQGGGILISDGAVLLFLFAVGCSVLLGFIPINSTYKPLKVFGVLIIPFTLYAWARLIAHRYGLNQQHFLIALSYLLRLCSILLLLPAYMMVASSKSGKRLLIRVFISTYIALLVLGYAQLFFFPSLAGNSNGWDPHMHRMVATWFDPNFFGAFLVMGALPVLFWSRGNLILLCAILPAIALTSSRSSWVALIITACITLCLWLIPNTLSSKSRKNIFFLGCLSILGFGSVIGMFPDRVTKLFTHDPTAELRVEAYKDIWHGLVEPNIVFGVGYNAYQFSAQRAGLVKDFAIHSRAGADNSFMTLLVTVGAIGTALFLFAVIYALYWHIRRWFLVKNEQSLLCVWAIMFLSIHSQFVNSFLYPHLLITLILIVVITTYE